MQGCSIAALLDSFFGDESPFGNRHSGSALDQIVRDKRRSAHGLSDGDQMTLDCLADLTAACLEVANTDGMPQVTTIADLNGLRDLEHFGTGTFALACDRVGDQWNLDWFNSYARDFAPRVMQGAANEVEPLFETILTKIMKGEIASSVIRACGISVSNLAMDAAAGMHAIIALLGAERFNTLLNGHRDRFELLGFQSATCIFLQRLMSQDDLLNVFREEEPAMIDVQLYVVGGGKELARHNIWVLKTALGLRQETKEDDPTDGTPAWVRPIPHATPPSGPREPALAH